MIDVDEDWFTQMLRRSTIRSKNNKHFMPPVDSKGNYILKSYLGPNGKVESMNVQILSFEKGKHGDKAIIKLNYVGPQDDIENAPASVLVKAFPQEIKYSKGLLVTGFVREIFMYNYLLPKSKYSAPCCYYAVGDTKQEKFCMILEDLS